ncbi:uncharacterized protein LOC143345622 [Colletes latitarsis]|uniref:uncharacterized protein LOC143345622 n=1 Tax=Colletes latitarsis TaxID=2605962 RepID=UPI004034F880
MNNDRSSSQSIVSESEVSISNVEDELNLRDSVDRDAKNVKSSVTSNIAKKIRSKLPNVAGQLKRLIRSKIEGKFGAEKNTNRCSPGIVDVTESILSCAVLETPNASTINGWSIPEDGDSVDWSVNQVVGTGWHYADASCDPSIYFTTLDSEEPSTSTTYADAEDQTGNHTMNSTTSTTIVPEPTRMVSNSMNTIAGSILEFIEALTVPFGTQAERFRDREPRIIPLVYIENGDRQMYHDGTVNGESGSSRSSTIGSESSSSSSENQQPEMRNRRIGQDPVPQLYSVPLNVIIRKPICRQDDEPTIY